jgi:predicted ATPase
VLRRLAVFVGQFTIEAALAVVTCPAVDEALAFGAIDSLVAKSMVAARPVGAMMRYRLLEATRAYVLEIRAEAADLADLPVRHARYFQRWLDETAAEWPTLSTAERASRVADFVEVRAALEWCFGARGSPQVGVGLAASATRVLWAMLQLSECQRWAERALAALDDTTRGTAEEMHLQAALGMSQMFSSGRSEAVRGALTRSLAISEARGEREQQRKLLVPLFLFYTRNREFNTALTHAANGVAVAETLKDPTDLALARTLNGIGLHFTGNLNGAREELEAAIAHGRDERWSNPVYLASGHHIWAAITLARNLWLQGHPAQAVDRAVQTIEEAAKLDESLNLALHWGSSVFIWAGDMPRARHHVDWFISQAETNTLGPNLTIARCIGAALAIQRGDAKEGVENLQRCLEKLHPETFELHTELHLALIQGFIAIGRSAEALRLADDSIGRVEENGDLCYMPELLRLKGNALLAMPKRDDDGETYYQRSLELSRRQGATGWELRTSIDFAALKADQGRPDEARALLTPVVSRFLEGSDTADVKASQDLLAALA